MKEQKHIIKKQILDIQLDRQENSFQIQNSLSAQNAQISSIIDEVCTSVSDPNRFIQLEKEFPERLRKCFYETLFNRVNELLLDSTTFKPLSGRAESLTGDPQINFRANSQSLTQTQIDLDLLQYFLKSGTFPWWSEKITFEELEKIFINLLKNSTEEVVYLLRNVLIDKKVRSRIIYQFSDKLLLKIAGKCSAKKLKQIQYWIKDIKFVLTLVPSISTNDSQLRLIFWDFIFMAYLTTPDSEFSEKKTAEIILSSIAMRQKVSYPSLILSLHKEIKRLSRSKHSFQSKLPKWIENQQKEIQSYGDVARPERPGSTSSIQQKRNLSTTAKSDENIQKETHKTSESLENKNCKKDKDGIEPGLQQSQKPAWKDTKKTDDQPADYDIKFSKGIESTCEEIYIDNAGLILVWPYLGHFFQSVGLMYDGAFVDEESINRAIHLLQFLATGEEQTAEYFLPLNKLLCGLDLENPIGKDVHLSKQEKEECEKLLNTVIKHWSALKNTSVTGFRASFLQRKGVLQWNEENWLLRVERKTYDLLLERIPWSISIIKLSWMKTALYVEW